MPPVIPTRIADMSHLSRAIGQVSIEAARAPMIEKQYEGATRVLSDGLKHLDHVQQDAQQMLAAGRLGRRSMIDPRTLTERVAAAHTAVEVAAQAAAAVQPERSGLLRRQGWSFPPQSIAALQAAASAVAQAEAAAAAVTGASRNQLDYHEQATRVIPDAALSTALEHPQLRKAVERQHLPLQSILRYAGPMIGRIAEGDVEVVGAENIPTRGPFVLAPTHARMSDGPVWLPYLGRQTDTKLRPLMKTGIGPIAGVNERLLATGGVFTVAPGTGTGDQSLAAAREMLRNGQSVVIFPEGRMVSNDLVGQARDGVARLALDMDIPIIPVGIYGTKKAEVHGQGGRGVTMVVGAPIDPSGAPAGEHNVGVVRDQVQKSLIGLYDEARGRWREQAAERHGISYDDAIAAAR